MYQSYVARHKDEQIREISSSGGVFTAIAQQILSEGGVVCGAGFSDNLFVKHMFAETPQELSKLAGSKYVQSRLGDSFLRVREYLENGKLVFFAGTPCQVEALLSFLGPNQTNLLTMDLVCHGVPSPGIWQQYLRENGEKHPIISANFRDKKWGWKKFHLSLTDARIHKYGHRRFSDPYMQTFLRDFNLRPSCYQCTCRGLDRPSDITVSDAWGIDLAGPSLNDDRGLTWVLVRTETGRKFFKKAAENLIVNEIAVEDMLPHNRFMEISTPRPDKRELFWTELYDRGTVIKSMGKYSKNSIWDYIAAFRTELRIKSRIREAICRISGRYASK